MIRYFSASMVFFGIVFLLGGIFMRQYKLWANRLLTIFSVFFIIKLWFFILYGGMAIAQDTKLGFAVVPAVLLAIFCSAPSVLLIWFLNKRNIRQHFS